MNKKIMIVGVGGQGTLLASRILGNTVINEGYDVKVSEVHGYIIYEDEKMADEGSLAYRGHDINILAKKCGINKRYKFEEAVFLLLYGRLPERQEFEEFLDPLVRKPPLCVCVCVSV